MVTLVGFFFFFFDWAYLNLLFVCHSCALVIDFLFAFPFR